MSTILFAWELGGGLGHVTRLLPLARELKNRGHRIIIAARDLLAAEQVFAGSGIAYLQAPFQARPPADAKKPPCTYAHILHNVGFSSVDSLATQVHRWQQLYKVVEPDLIVFDHSPTAILAARATKAKRVVFGDGFCCPPPDDSPLPNWRPWLTNELDHLYRDEEHILSVINHVLSSQRQPLLGRVTDIFSDAHANLLTTFEELDHYGPRKGVRYLGSWPQHAGTRPQWPDIRGKRVFAYLKPDASAPLLFELLRISGLPTIVYMNHLDTDSRLRYQCDTLHFADNPVDLRQAGEECDFAILNATHGTTAAFLLAGKPILQLPIYLEQSLTANNTVRLGAGLAVNRAKPQEIATKFRLMVESNEFNKPAADFAQRYAKVDPQAESEEMIGQIETLLPMPATAPSTGYPINRYFPQSVDCGSTDFVIPVAV